MNEKTNCRSVFKDGSNATTVQEFTDIWVTLINQIERSKEILSGVA